MSLLFVADPLESFKTYKDTTIAMMREAARRGHELWACEPADLVWRRGSRVVARRARAFTLTDDEHAWFDVVAERELALADTRAVLMRKDPPFDSEYFYATHLLQQAEREGARVFNKPAALRDHPEKLAILEFPQWIAPTLVTRSEQAVRAFHAEHGEIIVKPLDGMGGRGIFRVGADGMNLGSIIETLNQGGRTSVMVQRYLPEIAETLAPQLFEAGLLLVGLDVIGDYLTEVNVTSPTCFQEITQQSGFNVAGMMLDALERAAA
jgi:glutathione synthase